MSIQKILLSFDPKKENILPLLHEVNSYFGYISKENAYKIADYFKIAPARLYGLITSSEIFKTEKGSQLEIAVCNGSQCKMRGSDLILSQIEKYFQIKADRIGKKKVELKTISCIGQCKPGPVITINGNVYENVKPHEIDDILKNYI